jgi:hypothetical protein
VATYLPTYDGVVTASNVAVAGNVTAQYFLGNGAFLTGVVGGAGNYSNVDVKAYLATGDGVSRLIQGYYANLDLGATARLYSYGSSAASFFGHDGFANVNINYVRAGQGDIQIATNNGDHNWTFSNAGNLTLPAGGRILESTYLSADSIILKPNGGTSTQYLEIAPTAVDGNHVHLMTGSGTELFLGDDNHYVKLANTGGVVINSNDGTGNTAQWTFGKTGTTQFPGSKILAPAGESITMWSDNYSQLMWENANLTVAPNMAINSNFYVAQNNATLDIGYRDGSSTQIIKSWYWNADGNLKLPSGGYILNSDDSIYGGGNYSNVEVAAYLPTYTGNIANITLSPNGVLTFADGTTQITAGGGSYSNVQVATYLPTYAGTVSASLVNTSGNILSSGLSVFGNTRIGLAGVVSGQFHSVVGNITQTSSGGAVYINTTGNLLAAAVVAGAVTSTGTVAVNAATGITTNQATFLLANTNATTINMGGAATTIRMGTITSNVFVGGAIGNSNKELTLRAQGNWNIATSIDSNGGFNSPPYANQPVIGGSGTGMTANYSATGGYLTTVTIYNPGTGYRSGDVLSVPGGIAGNTFVLTNYSSTLTGNSSAAYTFGIEGNLTVPGNVTARNFIGSGALLTSLPGYAYSNVNVASYLSTATINTTGNITAAYLVGNISITGNVTGTSANVTLQAGSYSSTFDNQGNVTLPTAYITGNVTAGYFIGNGALLTGIVAGSDYSNVQVATYLPTYSGNLSAANLLMSSRTINSTSTTVDLFNDTTLNINAFGAATDINIGVNNAAARFGIKTPNIWFDNLANLATYSSSINVFNTTATGVNAFGAATTIQIGANASATTFRGNVTANYFVGNGALLTGIVAGGSSYSNVQVATYLPTYSGNIANIRLGVSGALTFPDGTQQTTAAFGGGSNYGNANVAAYLPTYTGTTGITQVGTLGALTVTGNATVGNLIGTEANTRIIANVYTTTFDIYGNVSFPGNVNVGGLGITMPTRPAFRVIGNGGQITATANITSGNFTVDYNQGNYLTTSTGVFTAPIAGLYSVHLVVRTATNNNLTINQAAVLQNNANIMCMVEFGANTSMNHTGVSTIAKLAVGDVLTAKVLVGTISFDGNDNWSVAYIG